MMKKFIFSIVAVMAMGTFAIAESGSYAPGDNYVYSGNDNSREGFRLGLGIGIANTSINSGGLLRDDYSETGFATTFEIGYAPTNQVSINYLNNVNWADANYNNFSGGYDGASGFSALTVNYYIDNAQDTMYVVGGIAAAGLDSHFKTAGVVGIGYAMDNIEFEINGLFGKHYDDNMQQFFFTISYLFY